MIKTWTIQHFKSVYKKTELEMAPLTIFAGANSSGKSTIIQSLLLTAQTLQSTVESRPIILNGHILRLGTFDDVVSNNAKHEHINIGFELIPVTEEQKKTIARTYYGHSFVSRLSKMISSVECHFTFSSQGPEEEKEALQLQPRIEECAIKTKFNIQDRSKEEEVSIRRSNNSIKDRVAEFKLSDEDLQPSDLAPLEYEVVKPTNIKRLRRYYSLPSAGKPAGATLKHFLPGKISIVFDAVEEQVAQLVQVFISAGENYSRSQDVSPEDHKALGDSFKNIMLRVFDAYVAQCENEKLELAPGVKQMLPRRNPSKIKAVVEGLREQNSSFQISRDWNSLPSTARRAISLMLSENVSELQKAIRGDREPQYVIAYSPLPDISEAGVEYTQNFFSRRVKYLGPLRDEPKPVYPLAGATDPGDVGFRGEHTAAVLDVHRNTQINYIPSKNFARDCPISTSVAISLQEAVLDWLRYMGVANDVTTLDKGKLGHELKVATAGETSLHDLTHVGVGVSQVLPILVLSLLAEPGSTLIFEQPELHLHPRVQTRLADFFVSMTLVKKQCIVETHSEYLINRLRYQTARSEGDELSKNVIMYFVEKEKGYSTYRLVRINKFGVIEKWPRGFFDENEENATAILKAGMEKRKAESKKNNA